MPQTSYSLTAIAAQPGMAFDAEAARRDAVSAVCAANLPFGVLCEYNASGLAVPVQSTPTNGQLSGTVTVTNGSAAITFSGAQTLPKGTNLMFSAQPGIVYKLAAAVSASTAGTLTNPFGGVTSSTGTTVVFWSPNLIGISLFDPLGDEQSYQTFSVPAGTGSTAVGYLKGRSAPFMRVGRIWVAGDAGGTSLQFGPINVWHSSTGANPQGVFTFSPTSQTVGGEIDIAPGAQVFNPGAVAGTPYAASYTDPFGNVFKVYPVEINL